MKEIIAILISSILVSAKGPVMLPMHATAYCDVGITASGERTREGICATGIRGLIGNRAVIYQRLPDGSKGDYIGTYDILDTGCKESVIDIWCEEDKLQELIDKTYQNDCEGKIYVELKRNE